MIAAGLLAPSASVLHGQVVEVVVEADETTIQIGQETTLRVFAQVAAPARGEAERIFSWYVDVINFAPSVVEADFSQLMKTASDNDPRTSSAGMDDGGRRRGIYDTFLNTPGAGVVERVELFSVPVQGAAVGQSTLQAVAGTGVDNLGFDFIVAPNEGDDPLTGGVYSPAEVTIIVIEASECELRLLTALIPGEGGEPGALRLSFIPCPGKNHVVETRSALDAGEWTDALGAPHNSGELEITASGEAQFFRVRID